MHRFFVTPNTINGDQAHIRDDAAHQISRVLRMQPGDHITLLDGQGFEYVVSLLTIGKDEVTGKVESSAEGKAEPRHKITLYISLLNKADKFEWALQKCTELGAHAFVP
ncbi:MAG: RsmE family RNA methyltransferase, partial [Chloroflexia bacterium]